MKFHTFRIIALAVILIFLLGGSCLCIKSCSSPSTTPSAPPVTTRYTPPPPTQQDYAPPAPAAPAPRSQTAYKAPPLVTPPPQANAPIYTGQLTNADIKSILVEFLRVHGKNNGRDKWPNCIPNAPFKATAVKFNPGDHARYSSQDQSLWSQIKLDLNGDGIDDVKILLKDNVPTKLEHINAQGKTVGSAEYL